MKELTKQQDGIYRMLRSHIAQHGFPPTRADICKHFGFNSPTIAAGLLEALERRGYIELIPETPRGIRLVEPSDKSGLPIVGRVALGQPILSEASIERRIEIDPGLFAPPADYLFRMVGESMSGAGILNGDLMAIHETEHASNGQIVVARINDEITVKSFRQKGNIVTLSPENDDYEAIRVDVREHIVVIEGVCVGILRREFA